MDLSTLDTAIAKLPRHRVGFYPTPFHALPNLSQTLGINVYMKREDLAGPSAISGSKTRLAEFILGRALEEGVTHLITQGAYLTNSGLQFAAACLSARITPILVLTRNVPRHGKLGEARGNYLLNQTMGIETHVIDVNGDIWTDTAAATQVEGRAATDLALEIDRKTEAAGVYPIVLVSYQIACQKYEDATEAELVKEWLTYVAGSEGQNASAEAAGSAPLSDDFAAKVKTAIDTIG